jgi:hypothetical protein
MALLVGAFFAACTVIYSAFAIAGGAYLMYLVVFTSTFSSFNAFVTCAIFFAGWELFGAPFTRVRSGD